MKPRPLAFIAKGRPWALLFALLTLLAAPDLRAREARPAEGPRGPLERALGRLGRRFSLPSYQSSVDWQHVHADRRFFERVGAEVISPWLSETEGGGHQDALHALNAERRANGLPWLHAFQEGHADTHGMPRLRLGPANGHPELWGQVKVELRLEGHGGGPSEGNEWRDITEYLRPAARAGHAASKEPPSGYRLLDVPSLVKDLVANVGDRRFGMHEVRVTLPSAEGGEAQPDRQGRMTLVVAPQRAYAPPADSKHAVLEVLLGPLNILGAQGVGMGTLEGLRRVVRAAREAGFAAVSTPPTTMGNPAAASPYDTMHRSFGDPRVVDLEVLTERIGFPNALFSGKALEDLRAARSAALIDPSLSSKLANEGLNALWAWFKTPPPPNASTSRAVAERRAAARKGFREWVALLPPDKVAALRKLGERLGLSDPERALFVQWAYEEQARAVQEEAVGVRADGVKPMAIGVMKDLPVVPNGAEVAEDPHAYLSMHAGAPPADDSPKLPQDWGGSIMNPLGMVRDGLSRFAATVAAAMTSAGGLRLDAAFWLRAQFSPAWTAKGAYDPTRSGMVAYPFREVVAMLTVLSHRHKSLLLAENLGTSPEGYWPKSEDAGLLGYALQRFAFDWGRSHGSVHPAFADPTGFHPMTMAAFGTWDMPSVGAVWRGRDIDLALSLGRITAAEASAKRERLKHWQYQLLSWLRDRGELPSEINPEKPPRNESGEEDRGPWTEALARAYRKALARARSMLVATPLCPSLQPHQDADPRWAGIWNQPGVWEGDGASQSGFCPMRQRTKPITDGGLRDLVLELGRDSARARPDGT